MCKCDLVTWLWSPYKAVWDVVPVPPPAQAAEEGGGGETVPLLWFDEVLLFLASSHITGRAGTRAPKGLVKIYFSFSGVRWKRKGKGGEPKWRVRSPSKRTSLFLSFPMTLFVLFLLARGYFWCKSLKTPGVSGKRGRRRKGMKVRIRQRDKKSASVLILKKNYHTHTHTYTHFAVACGKACFLDLLLCRHNAAQSCACLLRSKHQYVQLLYSQVSVHRSTASMWFTYSSLVDTLSWSAENCGRTRF